MEKLTPVKIIENTPISPNAYLLKFHRFFEFKAGQLIGITLNKDQLPRLYSIASTPNDSQVAILYQIKNDGLLTPNLAKNRSGETIYITPVHGKFHFSDEPAWWIATGTGIAPFYAMFLNKQQPQKLIQGGRKLEDIYFRTELTQLPDYVVCCTQDSGEGIYEGRLTGYLKNYINLPKHINYYLCGSSEMVVDVRNLLIDKGIAFHQIITEIYF